MVDRQAQADPLDQSSRAGLNLWFLGQAFVGPSLVVDWTRARLPVAGLTDSNPPWLWPRASAVPMNKGLYSPLWLACSTCWQYSM
ncbi:MAG: hypothetical protein HC898_00695 [Phycisphaerales bacterium]|nr:hypothetical protein [Phycisphaerales bacterium]